jgi:hypothetical protein
MKKYLWSLPFLGSYPKKRSGSESCVLTVCGHAFKPVAVKNSLIYVSKQISEEACAVLYGGHKFKLRTTQALDWFLVLIGENRQHIRHVCVLNELGMRNLPAVGRITDKLVDAKNLRSLKLHPKVDVNIYVDPYRTTVRFFGENDIDQSDAGAIITKLALLCEILLESLHRAQKSEDKLAGVVEIFHLDSGRYESVQEQLSVFWKSAVQLRVSDSEP